jgi:hypothetical protein
MNNLQRVIFGGLMLGGAPALAGGIPGVSGVIKVEGPGPTLRGVSPVFSLSAADRPAVFAAECAVGEEQISAQSEVLPPGERFFVALPAKAPQSAATCGVFASFANGLSERREVQLSWTWVEPPPPPKVEAEPAGPKPAPAAPKPAPAAPKPPSPPPAEAPDPQRL